jgi:ATP-dependent RNA helicase DDX27
MSTKNRTNDVVNKHAAQLDLRAEGEDSSSDEEEDTQRPAGRRAKAEAAAAERKKEGDSEDLGEDEGDCDELDSEDEEAAERERQKKEFFDDAPEAAMPKTFQKMELSRPILRAVTALGFSAPSLVQQRAIPIALLGRDLCACATTGSGKTAAFMLPCLERLLFRPKKILATRVLILSPTRELAVQVSNMAKSLAKFTDITFGLSVGGMALKIQEAELRQKPDIVVATPGRLVDHVQNTHSFDLTTIEILILDEADRLLEVGFKDELEMIIAACPRERQTMLFSATMTDEVDDLVSLTLHQPVRLFVNKNTQTTSNLTQEFIRIRQGGERNREAILLSLCTRAFKARTLIFVQVGGQRTFFPVPIWFISSKLAPRARRVCAHVWWWRGQCVPHICCRTLQMRHSP